MSNNSTYRHRPYTYFIKWSTLQVSYYGCRYARNCDPTDLWVDYFTSSKRVAAVRREHGEPDIIQVRKVFDTPAQCTDWEARVLLRLRVGAKNAAYLNLRPGNKSWNNTGIDFTAAGKKRRGFGVAKLATTGERLGRVSTDDPRWLTGEIVGATAGYVTGSSAVRNAAISTALKGKPKSPEHREKMRLVHEQHKGMVQALDTRTGTIVKISRTLFENDPLYEGATAKLRRYYEPATGNMVSAYKRDPRLTTGELVDPEKFGKVGGPAVCCLCCKREHYMAHFNRHLTNNYKKPTG